MLILFKLFSSLPYILVWELIFYNNYESSKNHIKYILQHFLKKS